MAKLKPCKRCEHRNVAEAHYCAHCGSVLRPQFEVELRALLGIVRISNMTIHPAEITECVIGGVFELGSGDRGVPVSLAAGEQVDIEQDMFARDVSGAASLKEASFAYAPPFRMIVNGTQVDGTTA